MSQVESTVTRSPREREEQDKTMRINIKRISAPSPMQAKEFRKVFELYDADKNGLIDIKELTAMVTNLQGKQPTEEEVQRMMSESDLNQDGCIDFDDFCYLMTR